MTPKISYCSTCMNRETQIKSTLEHNLDIIACYSGDVELVLINFLINEESERIHQWILSLGKRAGFSYYYTDTLKTWHASIAKNSVHIKATGKFLINLDCDNFIDHESLNTLLNLPNKILENTVYTGFIGTFSIRQMKHKGIFGVAKNLYDIITKNKRPAQLRSHKHELYLHNNGTYGHIGLSSNLFHTINGYNEELPPMGGQDRDLLWRAYNALAEPNFLHIPLKKLPVTNDKAVSIKNCLSENHTWDTMNSLALKISKDALRKNRLTANANRTIGISIQ